MDDKLRFIRVKGPIHINEAGISIENICDSIAFCIHVGDKDFIKILIKNLLHYVDESITHDFDGLYDIEDQINCSNGNLYHEGKEYIHEHCINLINTIKFLDSRLTLIESLCDSIDYEEE